MSEELEKVIFKEVDKNILISNGDFLKEFENIINKVEKIEKNGHFYIFYVNRKNKSEIIGKNGKNIKKIRKFTGNVIIKEKV